MIMW